MFYKLYSREDVTTVTRESTDESRRFHVYTSPSNGVSAPSTGEVSRIPNADEFGEEGIYQIYVHDFSNRENTRTTDLANSGTTVRVFNDGEVAFTIDVPSDGIGNAWQVLEADTRTQIVTPISDFRDIQNPERVPFNDPAIDGTVIDSTTLVPPSP